MYKKPFNFVLFSLAVVSLLVFYAAPAAAEITNVMDSNAFSYKYEGDALPDTIDLDGNGQPDWIISIDGGTSAIVTVGTRTALEIATAAGDDTLAYRASTLVGTTTCWPVANIQFDDGWTVECSVKVVSMVAGRDGAGLFRASPADNEAHGGIWIASTGQVWEGPRDALGSPEQQEDNTDDFHVFRLAQEPGAATYSAWRDGVLLDDSRSKSYDYPRNFLQFGDSASKAAGTMQWDYVRFTSGAYAPVPEPCTLALLGTGLLALVCYCRRRRRNVC